MKTRTKGDKTIYTLEQRRSSYGANRILGKKFSCNGTGDGPEIDELFENMKHGQVITITLEVDTPKRTYKIGQRFRFTKDNGKDEYMLVFIELNRIGLISLSSGSRWSEPIKVKDINAITEDEMKQLANDFGFWKYFELIEE